VWYFHLCADELVRPVEIGNTMIVIGVPVFDSSRKIITLEACHILMPMSYSFLFTVTSTYVDASSQRSLTYIKSETFLGYTVILAVKGTGYVLQRLSLSSIDNGRASKEHLLTCDHAVCKISWQYRYISWYWRCLMSVLI